jgi:hypothetical protein
MREHIEAPEVVVVTRREYAASPVHPFGEKLELVSGERAEHLIVRGLDAVSRIVPEEPNLVVVVEPEARLCEAEVELLLVPVRIPNQRWAEPPASIVTANNVDLKADPPREGVVAKRLEHQSETETARTATGVDPSVEDEQDAETSRPQPRARHDAPVEVPVRQIVSGPDARLRGRGVTAPRAVASSSRSSTSHPPTS